MPKRLYPRYQPRFYCARWLTFRAVTGDKLPRRAMASLPAHAFGDNFTNRNLFAGSSHWRLEPAT